MTVGPVSLGDVLAAGTRTLAMAGIESPQREARLLLAEASGLSAATLLGWPENPVNAVVKSVFESMILRRAAHEPLSRILGRRDFWSLTLAITPATLDPRPDTETIVEAALAHVGRSPKPMRILDLGTGSGCILLALLSELPHASGIGLDCSEAAAQAAQENALATGLSDRAAFVVGDWAAALAGRFDLVVSNPPYIPSGDIASLAPDVREHDPLTALDGGADGLAAYRSLARSLRDILQPDGIAVFELGFGQHLSVPALFDINGFKSLELRSDLAGIARALVVGWA